MFVSFIPVVKGYRKIGDEPAAALEGQVFDLYPMVSFLRHFRNLESTGDEETVQTPFKDLTGKLYKGLLKDRYWTEQQRLVGNVNCH